MKNWPGREKRPPAAASPLARMWKIWAAGWRNCGNQSRIFNAINVQKCI